MHSPNCSQSEFQYPQQRPDIDLVSGIVPIYREYINHVLRFTLMMARCVYLNIEPTHNTLVTALSSPQVSDYGLLSCSRTPPTAVITARQPHPGSS